MADAQVVKPVVRRFKPVGSYQIPQPVRAESADAVQVADNVYIDVAPFQCFRLFLNGGVNMWGGGTGGESLAAANL